MRIYLHRHRTDDWPTDKELREAYTETSIVDGKIIKADIHIREPFDRLNFPVERAWHELRHAQDPSFTNATHHPWLFHFCISSVGPLRFDYHGGVATRAQAVKLLNTGFVDV